MAIGAVGAVTLAQGLAMLSQGSGGNGNSDQSAKDAKKISSNNEANRFAEDRGYKDAHDLKKDYLKGQKDTTQAHYDIYENNKTGESFLKSKDGSTIIPID
jgi:hypothetical protein